MAKLQLINPSTPKFDSSFLISFVIVNTLTSMFNVCINVALVYGIQKMKLSKMVSYKFILCLSISDLCVGLIVQPLLTARLLIDSERLLPLIRLALQFFGIIFTQTSGMTLAIISFDRYLHMKHLLHYNTYMTTKRAKVLITFAIAMPTTIAMGITISAVYGVVVYVNMTWLCTCFVTLLMIVTLYARAYFSVRKRVMDNHISLKKQRSNQSQRKKRPDLEFAKGMFFILIAVFICYIPYLVLGMMMPFFTGTSYVLLQMLFYWALEFVYLLSSYNGIVLIIFDRKLRAFFKKRITNGRESLRSVAFRETDMRVEEVV